MPRVSHARLRMVVAISTLSVAFGQPLRSQEAKNLTDQQLPKLDAFRLTEVINLAHSSRIGVEVAPVGDALRNQLALADGHGVVVTKVIGGGPAEKAGIETHDVLLKIAGKPVSDTNTMHKLLDKIGKNPVPVVLVRGGKKLTIKVTPKKDDPYYLIQEVVFLDNRWIGVGVVPVGNTLRSQLRLPPQHGLVVTNIEAKSPAAKAGIELHDVLLEFGGKPLAEVTDLRSQIKELGEKSATMKVVRSGQALRLKVTPAQRPVIDVFVNVESIDFTLDVVPAIGRDGRIDLNLVPTRQPTDPNHELSELIKHAKQLALRLEALEQSLKKSKSRDSRTDD